MNKLTILGASAALITVPVLGVSIAGAVVGVIALVAGWITV